MNRNFHLLAPGEDDNILTGKFRFINEGYLRRRPKRKAIAGGQYLARAIFNNDQFAHLHPDRLPDVNIRRRRQHDCLARRQGDLHNFQWMVGAGQYLASLVARGGVAPQDLICGARNAAGMGVVELIDAGQKEHLFSGFSRFLRTTACRDCSSC
ncbi:hypothetical protein [Massilia sp. TSP1-1-2]|uniref:hypothetical protein n=1 Tax=Massilia sp. TSP1-1-2 TaxID=2804649 RepID=UPI003CF8D408